MSHARCADVRIVVVDAEIRRPPGFAFMLRSSLCAPPGTDDCHYLVQPAGTAPDLHLVLQRDAAHHQQHDTAREP